MLVCQEKYNELSVSLIVLKKVQSPTFIVQKKPCGAQRNFRKALQGGQRYFRIPDFRQTCVLCGASVI